MRLYIHFWLFLGCAASSDIPFVFNDSSSNVEGYNPKELENISSASPDLTGVPAISTLNDSEVLVFPAGSNGSGEKSYKTVGEIKEEFGNKFWQKTGQVLFLQGRSDESLNAFNKSIQENPKCAESWYEMGYVLLHTGRYEESIESFDVAIALNPSMSDAWNSKAEALYLLGRYNEALQACDLAIQSDPTSANAWYTRAIIL